MAKTPVASVSCRTLEPLFERGQLAILEDGICYDVQGRAIPGGFGDVYYLKRHSDGKRCAMKVFRNLQECDICETPAMAAEIRSKYDMLFRSEAETLRQMSKTFPENFPCFYGAGEIDGYPYYLMERLDPMRERDLKRLKTDEERKTYICDVCDAVSALHSRKLVHFDIKPLNVFRRKRLDGSVKYVLGDFGSVHRVEKHNAKENLNSENRLSDGRHLQARTVGYKDPMDDKYTVHADIYALGQVVRDMFETEVPILWSKIVLRCISNNFKHRYASVADLKADVIRMERSGPSMLSAALSELMGMGSLTWSTERRRIFVAHGADPSGDGSEERPYGSIAAGVAHAHDEDVVWVLPGVYRENVVIGSKKIWLVSVKGAKKTVIHAADQFRSVVTLLKGADESLVEGFTLTGGGGNPDNPNSSYGKDYYGGGFNCRVSCLIRNCIIKGNGLGVPKTSACTFGGGIYVTAATVRMTNCLIAENYAWASGGALLVDGKGAAVVMDGCTVRENESLAWAFGHQGGLSLANEAVLSVSRSMISRNGGDQIGAYGGPHANGTRAQVESSFVEGGPRACNIQLFLPRPNNFKSMREAKGNCGCSFS